MSSILKPVLGSQLQLGHSLACGLVGYWLLNEGSGNKVFDLSGNGRNGVAAGTISQISWQSGPDDSVIDFVGDAQAGFQFPAITFTSSEPWTVIFKCQSDGHANEGVLLGTYSSSNDFIALMEGSYIRFQNSAGGNRNFSPTSFTSWSTYAFVAKGDGDLHLYIDGVFVQTVSLATSFIIDNIGSGYPADVYAFDGRVSSVSIYNRALSASEIALLYQEPFCMFERDPIELWSAATLGAAPPVGMAGAMTTNTGYWGW